MANNTSRSKRKKSKSKGFPFSYLILGFGLLLLVIVIFDQSSRTSPGLSVQQPIVPAPTVSQVELPTSLPTDFQAVTFSGDPTLADTTDNAPQEVIQQPSTDNSIDMTDSQFDDGIGLHPVPAAPSGINLSATDDSGVTLSSGFECSLRNCDIKSVKPGHFEVRLLPGRDHTGFFAYKLAGAKGKKITIDLANAPSKWHTLNPVICGDVDGFMTNKLPLRADAKLKTFAAGNGPQIPDTSNDSWQYIPDVSVVDKKLRFTHEIEDNDAIIAMRPVFSPTYLGKYAERLQQQSDLVVVHRIGVSPRGNPLLVFEVSDRTEADYRLKPTIVIYAREHGDEHDSSWLAQGAIDYFLENDAESARLLKRVNFLVIPILDPDGAELNTYHRMTDTFRSENLCYESRQWTEFFVNWYNGYGRVDVVISLHNVESAEAPHLSCGSISKSHPDAEWAELLHLYIGSRMRTPAFDIQKQIWGPDHYFHRFSSFFEENYRSLRILYEANSQAKNRHLSLTQLRWMGATMAKATGEYLVSTESKSLRDRVWVRQRDRFRRWVYHNPEMAWQSKAKDPVYAEYLAIGFWGAPEEYSMFPAYQDFLKRMEKHPVFK